jgi:hypothetical protein
MVGESVVVEPVGDSNIAASRERACGSMSGRVRESS